MGLCHRAGTERGRAAVQAQRDGAAPPCRHRAVGPRRRAGTERGRAAVQAESGGAAPPCRHRVVGPRRRAGTERGRAGTEGGCAGTEGQLRSELDCSSWRLFKGNAHPLGMLTK